MTFAEGSSSEVMECTVGCSWKCGEPDDPAREDRDVRPAVRLLGTVSRCGDVGCCVHDQRVVPQGQTAAMRKRTTAPVKLTRLRRSPSWSWPCAGWAPHLPLRFAAAGGGGHRSGR